MRNTVKLAAMVLLSMAFRVSAMEEFPDHSDLPSLVELINEDGTINYQKAIIRQHILRKNLGNPMPGVPDMRGDVSVDIVNLLRLRDLYRSSLERDIINTERRKVLARKISTGNILYNSIILDNSHSKQLKSIKEDLIKDFSSLEENYQKDTGYQSSFALHSMMVTLKNTVSEKLYLIIQEAGIYPFLIQEFQDAEVTTLPGFEEIDSGL